MTDSAAPSRLPVRFQMSFLEQNLEALAETQPKLVQRIAWPVDGSHVFFDQAGSARYAFNFSDYPLELAAAAVEACLPDLKADPPFFAFGIGLGETVDGLLARFSGRKILAWEKDPWLLRLFLMRRDYAHFIKAGNLRLLLGTDLALRLSEIADRGTAYHPLLRNIYYNEAEWLRNGLGPKRILFHCGGLFVDHVAKSLKELGHSIFFLDMKKIALEEIEHSILQFMPQIVCSINYRNGLVELCSKHALTLLCWEVDTVLDDLRPPAAAYDRAFIFSYRKKNRDAFLSAGFVHADYLPLAADPEARAPQALSEAEQDRYTAPIAFVGNLLFEQARKFLDVLTDAYREYCRDRSVTPCANPFAEILARQAADYAVYRLPQLFREHLGDFEEFFLKKESGNISPVRLLSEWAAVHKRLTYVSHLRDFNVKVWGDAGWKTKEAQGVSYMGPAGHHHELNKIYSHARINLDVNRLYQSDMVNMRIFDVLACGGFLLAEYSPALEELFDLERDLAIYRNLDELECKVRHYLDHPAEARAVARRGMQTVREKHTIRMRVEQMLRTAGTEFTAKTQRL